MSKVNSFLTERLKVATEKFSKMTNLAELSSSGNLSSFSGVFRVANLTQKEHESLETLLQDYMVGDQDVKQDLQHLVSITQEVKAINNQAAILHGERIKRAQEILKKYQEGAFTAWLIAAYGNRQTPYNFLQYYELYKALPQLLHPKLDAMPRQAVYTLASRNGLLEEKERIIKNYSGEPKEELISLIRQTFPLADDDKRAQDLASSAVASLKKLKTLFEHPQFRPSLKQKAVLKTLLKALNEKI